MISFLRILFNFRSARNARHGSRFSCQTIWAFRAQTYGKTVRRFPPLTKFLYKIFVRNFWLKHLQSGDRLPKRLSTGN
jgi:hypothetical protein